MAGNPFSARPSFDVQDPNQVGNNLANNIFNLARNRETNFQSGINNAISQAAQNYRNQQEIKYLEDAKEKDLNQKLELTRLDLANKNALALQESKNSLQKELADIGKLKDFNFSSLDSSKSLNQHKMNLVAERSRVALQAAEKGLDNNPQVLNSLNYLDNEIKATNAALGRPDEDVYDTTTNAGIERLDEIEDDNFSQAAEGLKIFADSQRNKLLGDQEEVVDTSVKATREKLYQLFGEEPVTEDEVKIYNNVDKIRAKALSNTVSRNKLRSSALEFSSGVSPKLLDVHKQTGNMLEALNTAKSYGASINTNAAAAIRGVLGVALKSDDSEAAIEIMSSLKADNLFDFPKGTPEEIKNEVYNKYLTGLDQLIASSSFIARAAGNTGVLTARDVAYAMYRYVSANGNLDQFINNLEEGRATTAVDMSTLAYLYEDDLASALWRDKVDEVGYKRDIKSNALRKTEQDLIKESVEDGDTTFSNTVGDLSFSVDGNVEQELSPDQELQAAKEVLTEEEFNEYQSLVSQPTNVIDEEDSELDSLLGDYKEVLSEDEMLELKESLKQENLLNKQLQLSAENDVDNKVVEFGGLTDEELLGLNSVAEQLSSVTRDSRLSVEELNNLINNSNQDILKLLEELNSGKSR